MEVPLEISYRDVPKTEQIEELIDRKIGKLEKIHDNIISCHIVIERPQKEQQSGNPYRVRITLRIPPGHELVATSGEMDHGLHDSLDMIVRDAFDNARRQLKKHVDQQQNRRKKHPQQQTTAFVEEINREGGYGFLKAIKGDRIYFNKNSVLHNAFDRLEVGSGVHYVEEEGEKGPQASTVQLVDKPGVRAPRTEKENQK